MLNSSRNRNLVVKIDQSEYQKYAHPFLFVLVFFVYGLVFLKWIYYLMYYFQLQQNINIYFINIKYIS